MNSGEIISSGIKDEGPLPVHPHLYCVCVCVCVLQDIVTT